MKKNNSKVTFNGNPVTLPGDELKPGQKAADFTMADATLSTCSLSDFRGKFKVVAEYPSIDTKVCTALNRKFNEIATEPGYNASLKAIMAII